jgi:hypothetical protein
MDEFSAHLERGWDLVQRGDPRGAEVSARRALELDDQSPEVYNLLGYVAALRGDFEDAIESYSTAIALDDTYLEAMLNAAEVHIHPLGEFDQAIRMCDTALDLAENDDEIVDALLLKFDSLLGKNELDEARQLCDRFPRGPFENPNHAFLVGRAYFEAGDAERAAPLIEEAVRSTPTNPEAWYYLALVREKREDLRGAADAFLRSRELDLQIPPPPWSLSPDTFLQAVVRACLRLDPEVRVFLRNDEIFIADSPGVEVVADGVDPRALVLPDGITTDAAGHPTARLFVYQRNVERLAGSIENIEQEVHWAIDRELRLTFLESSPEVETTEERRDGRTLN